MYVHGFLSVHVLCVVVVATACVWPTVQNCVQCVFYTCIERMLSVSTIVPPQLDEFRLNSSSASGRLLELGAQTVGEDLVIRFKQARMRSRLAHTYKHLFYEHFASLRLCKRLEAPFKILDF